jgi:GTP-binding protein
LIDVSDGSGRPDPIHDFNVIRNELSSFETGDDEIEALAGKPMIVVATKIDAANPEKLARLRQHARKQKLPFYAISAVTGEGVEELKYAMARGVLGLAMTPQRAAPRTRKNPKKPASRQRRTRAASNDPARKR